MFEIRAWIKIHLAIGCTSDLKGAFTHGVIATTIVNNRLHGVSVDEKGNPSSLLFVFNGISYVSPAGPKLKSAKPILGIFAEACSEEDV